MALILAAEGAAMDPHDPFIDHDCAAAIVEMLRNDVEELTRNSKGKQKAGELTDNELALQLCLEELNLLDDVQAENTKSRSVSAAVISDCLLIEEALNENAQFASDRELAMRLSGNTEAQRTIAPGPSQLAITAGPSQLAIAAGPYNGLDEDKLDDDVRARIVTRKFADRYHLRNPPWHTEMQAESSSWAASKKPAAIDNMVRCIACVDEFPWFDTLPAPCSESYCGACISTLFAASITDESLYPPRCCGQAIPFDVAKHFLSPGVAETFAAKREELDTKNRVYCHRPLCSVFIPPANIRGDVATCPRCANDTCAMCKAARHDGDCPEDMALKELIATANAEGWQRCNACSRMVELEVGCNHMT